MGTVYLLMKIVEPDGNEHVGVVREIAAVSKPAAALGSTRPAHAGQPQVNSLAPK